MKNNPREAWPIEALADSLDLEWFDYQIKCFEEVTLFQNQGLEDWRLCLYYRTGAGKTVTSLACLAIDGYESAVVVAPPSTHKQWVDGGARLGIEVTAMSHAKFRMADTKLGRTTPVIADEMHMFGGNKGKGWIKLERLARGLKAPMILASATPNYNDAERVYCIQRILDPGSCKNGFLAFVYKHCETEQNPFGRMPLVTGFQRYPGAEEYLADLPGVLYLPDNVSYTIEEIPFPEKTFAEMDRFGYDARKHRIIASGIEERHTRTFYNFVTPDGKAYPEYVKWITEVSAAATTPVMVYCDHATIANALAASLEEDGIDFIVVTGADTTPVKQSKLQAFKEGRTPLLVGTASLATGTDGLDKMCDTLIILDDTDDDSLRRQLIGRIMPRGIDVDASKKTVYRATLI